jgi:hypothetical protein
MDDDVNLPLSRRSSPSSYRVYGSRSSNLTRRITPRNVLIGVGLLAFVVFAASRWREYVEESKPPLYGEYHRAELELPQHNSTDAFSHGEKYLWVNNHVSGE